MDSPLCPLPQEAIAKLILAEIEDEKRWDEEFAGSQDKLADMAAEANSVPLGSSVPMITTVFAIASF